MIVLKEMRHYSVVGDNDLTEEMIDEMKDLIRDAAKKAGVTLGEGSWQVGPNAGGGWYVTATSQIVEDEILEEE